MTRRTAAPGRVAVAVLARHPDAVGKTRLTSELDCTHAAALRRALLLDTLDAVGVVRWPVHVFLDGGSSDADRDGRGLSDPLTTSAVTTWHRQSPGDLGARMMEAVTETLACGHDAVVLVGSDVPDLPRGALVAAGLTLTADEGVPPVVFGPATDGGFYLVGTTNPPLLARAFDGVTWSQPGVLDDVTARLVAAGGSVRYVERWRDIDTPDDVIALVASASPGAARTRALARMLARRLSTASDRDAEHGPR